MGGMVSHDTSPSRTAPARRRLHAIASYLSAALVIWALVSLAVVVWDLLLGGFHVTLFGIRISSSDPIKPFRNGAVCAAAALVLHDRDHRQARRATLTRWSPLIGTSVAILFVAATIRFGIFAAGDSDPYGYVSQAHLWASGRLTAPSPLLKLTPQLGQSVAPSGYRLSPERNTIVPTYAPGYPLVMAAALRIAGPSAVYFVAPLLGGLTVWLTFVLGRRVAGDRAGLIASVLMACSPIFLFQAIEPMSDVPATAWWLVAWVAASVPRPWMALVAGVASALAVLTRPNLVPLAAIVALFVAREPRRVVRLALFAAPVTIACLAVAALNTLYYGGPLQSGYGALSGLYSWSYAGETLRRYSRWLVDLHTPVVGAALAAPFVGRVKHAWWLMAFCAATLLSYVFYFPFENWTFLRFLLPMLPFVFVLTGATLARFVHFLPVAFRRAALVLVCALLASQLLLTAQRLGVFIIHHSDRRYAVVGEYAGRVLPPNAAVITQLHSGSIRLYANRDTVRWDWIPPGRLDSAVEVLRTNGYEPHILLEDHEEAEFRTRFGAASVFGSVDWPPAVEYLGVPRVRIYALADRGAYLNGQRVLTKPLLEER